MSGAPPPDTERALTLLLIRHGETAWNAEGRVQGHCDISLSPVGQAQARALAERLRRVWLPRDPAPALPGPPHFWYASDLDRAAETARIAASGGAAIRLSPLLRERSYGEWEGLTADEGRAKFGAVSTLHQAGESYAAVHARMMEACALIWNEAARPVSEGPGIAAVFGHGGSLRALLCRATGQGPEAIHRFHLDNTGISIVTFRGPTLEKSEGRIMLLNDTAHLFYASPGG